MKSLIFVVHREVPIAFAVHLQIEVVAVIIGMSRP